MASTPGNARIELESNPYTLTGDTYSNRSLLGIERRYTIPERIQTTGPGLFTSTVVPATDVRLLITGVSVEWGAIPGAAVSVSLGVTLSGSALLGTADMTAGTFVAAIPTIHLPAGAPVGGVVQAHPQGLNLVTRAGNGSNALFRVAQTGPAGFVTVVTVFYSPFYASDLAC